MFNSISELYYEYSNTEAATAFDQSIYDAAHEDAVAVFTAAISGKEPMTERDIDSAVMCAMGNAKTQGFIEGFAYASKLWAEISGK